MFQTYVPLIDVAGIDGITFINITCAIGTNNRGGIGDVVAQAKAVDIDIRRVGGFAGPGAFYDEAVENETAIDSVNVGIEIVDDVA